MDQIQQAVEPCKDFIKDSVRLVKRCTKPDRKGKFKLILFFLTLFKLYPKMLPITTILHNFLKHLGDEKYFSQNKKALWLC